MSKPREVIARAIAVYLIEENGISFPAPRTVDAILAAADAVIDALEKMEVTDKMAAVAFNWSQYDESVAILWRAMVGAMRSNE